MMCCICFPPFLRHFYPLFPFFFPQGQKRYYRFMLVIQASKANKKFALRLNRCKKKNCMQLFPPHKNNLQLKCPQALNEIKNGYVKFTLW